MLRSIVDYSIIGTLQLPKEAVTKLKSLQWCTPRNETLHNCSEVGPDAISKQRVLVISCNSIYIYDTRDLGWYAEINGASSNTGKIANVETGWTQDEFLVFSDFGIKATIWSLKTGRGVEIRDPKFPDRGHEFRLRTGHLAVLTRPLSRDVVIVLSPGTHELVNSFTLATTDAQGLKWSPNGMWLVTWDTASSGFALYVYSLEGYLFKTYFGTQDAENPGLGIKLIEWDPSGRYIAIGSYTNQVVLLDGKTVRNLSSFALVYSLTIL